MKSKLLALLCLIIAGCAVQAPPNPVTVAARPVTCAKDCAAVWARAESWVARNTTWRIQIANADLISTYGPDPDNSPSPAFIVSRKPLAEGRWQVSLSIDCGIETLGNWPFYRQCADARASEQAAFQRALTAPLKVAAH